MTRKSLVETVGRGLARQIHYAGVLTNVTASAWRELITRQWGCME